MEQRSNIIPWGVKSKTREDEIEGEIRGEKRKKRVLETNIEKGNRDTRERREERRHLREERRSKGLKGNRKVARRETIVRREGE